MAVKTIITDIESRVQRLMDDHRRLESLCGELTAERDALLGEKRALQEQTKAMERELSALRLGEGLAGGGGDRTKARARVNRLMREVDKCIALLNKAQ